MKSTYSSIIRWSIRSADHVIRSDQHDRYADQRKPKEDDASQHKPRGDDTSQRKSRGDDASWWLAMVWLGNLGFQFVIKGAVIHLN